MTKHYYMILECSLNWKPKLDKQTMHRPKKRA